MPSKKLMVIGAVVLVLVLGAGVGGFMYMTKANADEDTEETSEPAPKKAAKKHEAKEPPVYVALDPFVANVKDPSGERVAQIGVTLVVDNAKTQDLVKQYLPGIRSDILMLLGQYSADNLLTAKGKEELKKEIGQSVRGSMNLPLEEDEESSAGKPLRKNGRPRWVEPSPIQQVLFSSFIVQ